MTYTEEKNTTTEEVVTPPVSDEKTETVSTEAIDIYKDKFLRMQADYDNFRKDTEKRRTELALLIKADIVSSLLPVMDNWNTAWNHFSDEEKKQPHIMGVGYIKQQLEEVIRNFGVMSFSPKIGDTVDYTKHEALHTEVSTDPKLYHTIAKVVRDGYVLGEMVVRPAGVIVYAEHSENQSNTSSN